MESAPHPPDHADRRNPIDGLELLASALMAAITIPAAALLAKAALNVLLAALDRRAGA